ncbi:relaxase/mobilization nuclease domain-containing protein [Chitinophaga varians]|uniref:relaxase/mobilization nuclease domain-containing protein n=1 Tax=Chitinophaga varians TaxID=2202339 RepID=UPI00165F602E|nr:relaxase/mobilization nuclease domain-containing protein [Chitinophaga varians]MBC9909110.1 relaxase/mobilization nuclease domain-containing protein [Chitinophaga varians]
MVVKIICGKSIKGALHYNENKVEKGTAILILASRFAMDADDLSVGQKLERFNKLISRNPKIKTNCLHLSLNFAREEQLSLNTLRHIAGDYMRRIGFGDQPYLVYLHKDAAHQHLHIISTNIAKSGKAISFHNLARDKSEPARKDIEKLFNLVVAQGRQHNNGLLVILEPVYYGKNETKAAISNIVREVAETYKYTSLQEFDALLKQFNVTIDRGSAGSITRQRGGLLYSIVDADGNKIGVPVKASDIYTKPVLSTLKKKMEVNKVTGLAQRAILFRVLNKTLARSSIQQPVKVLENLGIKVRVLTGTAGQVEDVFFIDNQKKSILSADTNGFNPATLHQQLWSAQQVVLSGPQPVIDFSFTEQKTMAFTAALFSQLTEETYDFGNQPAPVDRKKKKKKRRKP